MKVRKILLQLKNTRADREASAALRKAGGVLNEEQLDQITAAGGKTGASTNPVGD